MTKVERAAAPPDAVAAATPRRGPGFMHGLSPSMAVAVAALTVLLIVSAVYPLLPVSDAYTQNLALRTRPLLTLGPDGTLHLLGTDSLGRDLLSRVALAGRISLLLAAGAVVVSMILGTALGLAAGYVGGRLDNAIMSLADIQLAVPRIMIIIAVVAVVGPSLTNLAIILGVTSWVGYARVVRAQTFSLREREFVQAARALGATPTRIMLRHILPNAFPAVLILSSFELGQMVVLEASLSYLGLGVQPPLPAWGSMIYDGQAFLRTHPHLTILPGVAIFTIVAGVNFLTQAFTSERLVIGAAEANA